MISKRRNIADLVRKRCVSLALGTRLWLPLLRATWQVLRMYSDEVIQSVFFYWSALKMTKCQTLRKF